VNVALLADLQGPKIRVGEVNTFLHKGETIVFACDEAGENELPVQYQSLYQDVREGDKLLLDDGLLEVKVAAIKGKKIEAKVVNGGQLTSKKGINLPTGSINAEVVTVKDKKDAEFALENGADFLALSFVKTAEDVESLREVIKNSKNKEAAIVAKIERHEAVYNFEKILASADAIMVARGDLGIEVSQQKVPLIQKKITKKVLQCKIQVRVLII
jgi:pyruvate kinase